MKESESILKFCELLRTLSISYFILKVTKVNPYQSNTQYQNAPFLVRIILTILEILFFFLKYTLESDKPFVILVSIT